MSLTDTYFRHQCILRRLEKSPASLEQIRDYYELECETQGHNFIFSNRTFIRDKQEIFSLHKREIGYNQSSRKYFLEEDDMPDDFGNRIADAYNTYQALNLADGTAGLVYLEKRRPGGMEHFHSLLTALRNRQVVCFDYEKYRKEEISQRRVEPLALKEFRNRWYLLSKDTKDSAVKTFALDRMSNLDITRQQYKVDKNFDVNAYYRYCFGITRPAQADVLPEKIILSFTGDTGKYIKSLPLHESQQIIKDDEAGLEITLELYITRDLIMELLSHGHDVKVRAPLHLKKTLNGIFEKAVE